jgi:cell division protein FtsA
MELAEQLFDMPVRLGYPTGVSGLVDVVNSPVYATGVGLVLWGARHGCADLSSTYDSSRVFNRVFERMRRWFTEAF